MKAATTTGFGPSATLTLQDIPKPAIGSKDVLVEVHASSVNPKDWKLNQNISSLMPRLGGLVKPLIMGDDLAGIIVEKGSKVSDFELGDAVYGMSMALGRGACAEYTVIKQTRIARKPANISYSEAASIPLAALTALQGFELAGIKQGSSVLIIGASGGVGTFAVQIAKAEGAQVTGVCSGRNTELVSNLGADEVIDYTTRDFLNETNNFDIVFDATSYESLSSCSSLMQTNGIYITTGGNGQAYIDLFKANFRLGKQRARVFYVDSSTGDLDKLTHYIEQGQVTPVLDSQYPLEEIQQAYERSKTGRAVGKIVINVKD